jgi:hypothetical protein
MKKSVQDRPLLHFTNFNQDTTLAWVLTEDAILNGGPARIDRIDMKCCIHTKSHSLTLLNLAKTKKLTAKCAKAIIVFSPKPKYEPELPSYCAKEERNYVFGDEAEIEEASKEEGVLIDSVAG